MPTRGRTPRAACPTTRGSCARKTSPRASAPDHDTWFFSRVAGTFKEREGFHGCQMPEQLLGRIIRCRRTPARSVLDPFGGSGTTLAVAKKLGRRWIGFELSADYASKIRQRLAETRVGAALDGAADPLTSAPATPETPRVRQRRRLVRRSESESLWSDEG